MAMFITMLKHKWMYSFKDPTESFEGRNVIVTGATNGVGLEAAVKFVNLGASKVVIAARDVGRGERVKSDIEARTGKKGQLEVWELDMDSYESVVAFAERAKTLDHLDIVLLNAGVRRNPFVQSKHGWENDLQVNTLSTALLAILLLPKLKESKQHTGKTPVLEFTNSGLHQFAKIAPDALQSPNIIQAYNTKERFTADSQYRVSKLFVMYVANKLAEETPSSDVIVVSVCPGVVKTGLARDIKFPGSKAAIAVIGSMVMKSAEEGARTLVSGTTLGEKAHGRFWKLDEIQPVAATIAGEENKRIAERVWNEIVEALEKDVPSVKDTLKMIKRLEGRGWMPVPRFRPKARSHGTSSLLRYLFPHTRQRARAHLYKFRHEKLPSLKHRAQSRIYKYILNRQAQKLKGKQGILQRLRGHTRRLLGSNYLENEAYRRRRQLTSTEGQKKSDKSTMSYQESYTAREPGARRRKLAGYLKAANDLRQTYQQQYAPGWSKGGASYDFHADTQDPTETSIIRNGDEEMILFPSYARKHIRRKPEAEPGTIQQVPGEGRDARDTTGAGDAEFWRQRWDEYEDDNAIVDVDVRGWVYSPHKGQMSRKQRLFISLARQLVGIQAPPAGSLPASSSPSPVSSRDPSPRQGASGEWRHPRRADRYEILTAKEAERIYRRGEREAERAAQGAYSETPGTGSDGTSVHRTHSSASLRTEHSDMATPMRKKASWNQPADMSPAELAEANARLMARLRHFLAIPMANSPISIFFYNDKVSKQRTVYTNPSGHFGICAALDFIPTHVRVLASDKLSATEEILVTESHGVSVISDIDDTIKHSAISSGAREIFRNAFIRDLGDLTIQGVKEWYNRMAALGVKFHYVSNSPWQLFPVLSKYFRMAGLPPGSFHLKQYSGMLQGIFEPVAERKKGTLDKIARDFPERRFILIGDSGEADLEVYTDFVLENPGRVIAVFIRDITTAEETGFFDPSVGPTGYVSSSAPAKESSGNSSGLTSAASHLEDDDPQLQAAIQASLRDMEEVNLRRSTLKFPSNEDDHPQLRPKLPPRTTSEDKSSLAVGNLIDLSPGEEPANVQEKGRRAVSDTLVELESRGPKASPKEAPPPPKKPLSLRSGSGDSASPPLPSSSSACRAPPPPKPRRPSTAVHQPSPLAQRPSTQASNPNSTASSATPTQPTYTSKALSGLTTVYNNLPAIRSTNAPTQENQNSAASSLQVDPPTKKPAPPPPPPRRGVTAYPAAAASFVGTKAASAWQNAPTIPHPLSRSTLYPSSTQHASTFSTTASGQQRSDGDGPGSAGFGSGNGNIGTDYAAYAQAGMSKREIMWRHRWARAEQVMGEKGVKLRSWRVGSDVVDEAERLIKEAAKSDSETGERVDKGREDTGDGAGSRNETRNGNKET
ncbi:uncharacterized protein EI97DRAFT_384626 [Westerdykella ornata]|uniref:Phosphatidate phosphatase APP1 catalytic domain-containing protein n=1 Tax=Westerdykella ornata TaxID=318751 RepID=A0A6A6J9L5_WESOR|nr:uncharacterized protein EI97DRAFT_384626 [Westerdykella ornata]KAF2272947.1 hypothetical protein EI97DRAFT_384626 [Westerdykella ornata]